MLVATGFLSEDEEGKQISFMTGIALGKKEPSYGLRPVLFPEGESIMPESNLRPLCELSSKV